MTRETSFSSGPEDEPADTHRPLRVIVADDDRDQVLTLTKLLRDEGYEVKGLYGGRGLLRAIVELEPDVLILDLDFPEASGFEIAEKIRRRFGAHSPLLIAISGVFKKGSDRVPSQIVGYDHYVAKPLDPNTLLELLAKLKGSAKP